MQTTQFDITLRRITTLLSVAIITLVLIGATTGVLISFYYEPAAGKAYESLVKISTEVSYGWLFLEAHHIAGNGVVAVGLIQIVLMFLNRQFRRSWLIAWVSGILFTLSAIGLGWTAMILDWSQEGYWRFNLELGTIGSIPLIGHQLRDILTGGGGIDSVTVQHLYTIHSYVISVIALVLAIVHLVSVLWQEKQTEQEIIVNELRSPVNQN
ncbi:cytochrome b/b6 domain-containing protein [Calothrix sp. NIES-4101]|nr:cytochrome b/b6 domain-containing protein [Calothrix sp. NIES-4101]